MKRRNVNEDEPESSLISSKKGMQESRESCEICRNVGIAGLMMLKKLPRYSMTHLKTTSSINQKTKDVSVDGQTHQTLISSLDQIFHESTSPKCNKSRNGSVDRIEKHEKREVKSPERVERESRSKIGSVERPARERACRRRATVKMLAFRFSFVSSVIRLA
ncbi:hypothetical protein Bca52824_055544 [Brassica carinata]|uniref:Uncharacterized protein n=1 Tax=Brassica carinata TaxID=52824 RepID=A0A8X7UMW8_BRACI|nr:hypothetical protein Bca52824_055544 [Brassica carinata]